MHNNIEKGKVAESRSINFLKKRGFKILRKNFRTKHAEIDIIAQKDRTISFIEVKSRNQGSFGKGYEAVNKIKKEHITQAAEVFLNQFKYEKCDFRFDVISIDKGNIDFIIDAFNY